MFSGDWLTGDFCKGIELAGGGPLQTGLSRLVVLPEHCFPAVLGVAAALQNRPSKGESLTVGPPATSIELTISYLSGVCYRKLDSVVSLQ